MSIFNHQEITFPMSIRQQFKYKMINGVVGFLNVGLKCRVLFKKKNRSKICLKWCTLNVGSRETGTKSREMSSGRQLKVRKFDGKLAKFVGISTKSREKSSGNIH